MQNNFDISAVIFFLLRMCGERYFQIFDDLLLSLDRLQYSEPRNKRRFFRKKLLSHVPCRNLKYVLRNNIIAYIHISSSLKDSHWCSFNVQDSYNNVH